MNGPRDGWEIVSQAAELARRGESFALATVVWRQGPSSGQQGSRAIVTASGDLIGWIGGACAEPTVIREAQRAIVDGEARLLLLGTPDQFGHVPEGMTVIPISCQSEGAMEVYVEPVVAAPHLVVVGRSPMAQTLCELGQVIGWRTELADGADFLSSDVDARSVVVIATQGHGDEEAIEHAVSASPAYVGLVASRKRGDAVLGYLADRGVPQHMLDRVRVPAGLDLGSTSHREIAVAILAELVQLRGSGALSNDHAAAGDALNSEPAAEAIDPVCGMTVPADASSRPFERDGVTFYFCSAGCRTTFERDPAAYLAKGAGC
ncbi:MAG TPA: XdhC family protein [Acidimicrobiales bacterium]